jgi:hypothetical protein
VHVNSGGEPERDDTGLPPVDIEIPDDARELERDMQAYYRELRALRRDRRNSRLRGVLGRDGMVVPLLVCSLVFALVAGTLLTLFTATSIDQNLPGTAGSHAGRPSSRVSAPATSGTGGTFSAPVTNPVPLKRVPGPVASAEVTVRGKAITLDSLRSAVLLLVPARCGCDAAIRSLAGLARSARGRAYLVATPTTASQVTRLAGRLGGGLIPAVDDSGALGGLHTRGLAAVLVSSRGLVSYAQMLQNSKRLTAIVREAHV